MNIIYLYKDGANVFINANTISRMSFEKSDALKQSERVVKVVFTDGSTGTYVGHRNVEKALFAKASTGESTTEAEVE